jgi:hypothetical protein
MAHSQAVTWNGDLYVPAGEYMEDKIPANVIAKTLDIVQSELCHYKAIYNYEMASPLLHSIGDYMRGCDAFGFNGIKRFNDPKKSPKFEPGDKLITDDKDTHRAVVQKIVNSLLFIEGTVWKKVPSLQLCLNLNEGASAAWITVVHGAYGYNKASEWRGKWLLDIHLHHRYYSLDEIGRILRDVGPGVDVSWLVSCLKIHDLEAVRFNGASDYIGRALDKTVTLYADQVGSASRAEINDWLTARSAADRHQAFPREDIGHCEIESLFRLLDHDTGLSRPHSERIKRYVNGYQNANWDRNAAMPPLGHHQSDKWQAR